MLPNSQISYHHAVAGDPAPLAATINACLASGTGSKPTTSAHTASATTPSAVKQQPSLARATPTRATISFNDASSAPEWMKLGDIASKLASALHSADAMRDGRLLPEEVAIVVQLPQLGLSGQQQVYLQQLLSPDSRDGYCDYRTALLRSTLCLNCFVAVCCCVNDSLFSARSCVNEIHALRQHRRRYFNSRIEIFSGESSCCGGPNTSRKDDR